MQKNDLNSPPPPDENAILRLEVELRDKHQPKKHGRNKQKQFAAMDLNVGSVNAVEVSMEKVCDSRNLVIVKCL